MTRTVIFSQDSISTLKTFISTLTHKDIFEFTNVDYSVHIIHYNEKKNNTRFRKIYGLNNFLMFCFRSSSKQKQIFTSQFYL